jgi:HAD-hyrolase-like
MRQPCPICGDFDRNPLESGLFRAYGGKALREARFYECDGFMLFCPVAPLVPGYLMLAPTQHEENSLLHRPTPVFSLLLVNVLYAANRELIDLMVKLHDTLYIAVTTNSPWKLAVAVLNSLCIKSQIDLISCPRNPTPAVPFPALGKPSAELYSSIVGYFNIPTYRVLVIGDRQDVDIVPAQDLGLAWELIDERRTLLDVLRTL